MPEPMRPQPMTPTFWMVMSVSPWCRRRLVARATTRQGRRLVVGRSRRARIPDGDRDGAGPGAAPDPAVRLRLALGGATWRTVLSESLIERRHARLDGLGEDAQDHRRADRRLGLLSRGAGRAHAERQEGAGQDRGATAHADDLLCGDPHRDASLVVDDEGMERVVLQLAATMEERELDQERHADDVAPELLDQPERRGHRAARGEQVIDGEYALPRLDRVLVDGERVAPVLELVLDLDGLARELTELPHGDETRAQLVGERPAEDEPARLDGDHDVHALLLIAAREHVDHVVERRTVLEKGGDVLEEDPLGWEVPDVTDLRPEVGDVHRAPILRAPCRSAQGAASHQNLGYRAGGRTSEVTVTDSGPKEETVTRASLREYAAVQRERYLTATRGEKGALLEPTRLEG